MSLSCGGNKFIEYGLDWESFEESGLNIPGTFVITNSKQFLIGDINTLGGSCNCCQQIDDKEIIERYIMLCVPEWIQNGRYKGLAGFTATLFGLPTSLPARLDFGKPRCQQVPLDTIVRHLFADILLRGRY